MSEFKVGDRVRLQPHDGTHVRVDYDHFYGGELLSVFNVERIAPALPTTPGSVVQYADNPNVFFLTNSGWHYRSPNGHSGPSRVTPHQDITVIFDAGSK